MVLGKTSSKGWSCGLGKFPVPGRLTNLIRVKSNKGNARASALAVGADVGCLDNFSLVYHFSLLSPSL